METERYLRQLSTIDTRIKDKLDELKNIEDMAIGLGSPAMSKDKVQTSRKLDKMSTAMAKLVDIKDEYEKTIVYLTELKKTITKQIDSMDGNSYEVLSAIYIHGWTIKEIAYEQEKSTRTISRYHKDAIFEFETLYGSTYLAK